MCLMHGCYRGWLAKGSTAQFFLGRLKFLPSSFLSFFPFSPLFSSSFHFSLGFIPFYPSFLSLSIFFLFFTKSCFSKWVGSIFLLGAHWVMGASGALQTTDLITTWLIILLSHIQAANCLTIALSRVKTHIHWTLECITLLCLVQLSANTNATSCFHFNSWMNVTWLRLGYCQLNSNQRYNR